MGGEGVVADAAKPWVHVGPLDGLRAAAVLFVIGFHSGISWLRGGYYGVDIFFALSGFLITSLLVTEWERSGTISLRGFWARRARRLLPALFLLLCAVGVGAAAWPAIFGSTQLVGDTAATVGYAANWHFIFAGSSYFNQLNAGSALTHTWTLAIEEQFYVVWPIVLLVVLGSRGRSGRRHSRIDRSHSFDADPEHVHRRRRLLFLFVFTTVGASASAIWMAVLAPVGDPNPIRAYFGTDTQAQCLLIGAAMAALLAVRRRDPTTWHRRFIGSLGWVGAAGIGAMCVWVPSSSALAFHGGFAIVAVGSVAVIGTLFTSTTHPLSRLLNLSVIRYVGRISYGMYLWYLPVLMVMSPERTGIAGYPLTAARVGVIVAVASLSYHLIERPIRRGALAGWRGRIAAPAGAAIAVATVMLAAGVAPVEVSLGPPAAAATVSTSAASGHAVRILLVGDSMAGSLGVGLATVADRYGAVIINRGTPGCSVSMDQMIKILWYTIDPSAPCKEGEPSMLLDQYRAWVRAYDPDVVVYFARSDNLNQELHGRWTNMLEPSFDAWYASRLNQAVSVFSSEGARVVLLTSPYYQAGGEADVGLWGEDAPARVALDNAIIARVASSRAPLTSLFNLNALLSPHHGYAETVQGVPMRCTDGVHITIQGGQWVGERLLPRLVQLGKIHLDAPSTQDRFQIPVQSPPSWYTELPCAE